MSFCNETEQKVKGSRMGLRSASTQLVMHIRRFCHRESTRVRTLLQGNNKEGVFGHPSKASTTRKIGACPSSFTTSFKVQTTDKCIIAGILRTTCMFQIEIGENVMVGIRLATKLD